MKRVNFLIQFKNDWRFWMKSDVYLFWHNEFVMNSNESKVHFNILKIVSLTLNINMDYSLLLLHQLPNVNVLLRRHNTH